MKMRAFAWVAAPALMLGVGELGLVHWSAIRRICREDGPVESMTALLYVTTALLLLAANRKCGFRNVWLWGFTLLVLLIAGEEISWGQRIVGYVTPPALLALNTQQEMTFHNIVGVKEHIRAAGLMLIAGLCYIVPLSVRLSPRLDQFCARTAFPVFSWDASAVMTVGILFMLVPRLLMSRVVFALDELGEMALGLGFSVFAVSVLVKSVTEQDAVEMAPFRRWSPAFESQYRASD